MALNRAKTQTVNMNEDVSEVLFSSIFSVVKDRSEWMGTMTDLNTTLTKKIGAKNVPETWPGSPSALRVALNKVVNRIRNKGVSVKFVRTPDHTRTRLVVLKMQ